MAKCGNALCSATDPITQTTIEGTGTVFQPTSITIGADGYPVMSYLHDTDGHLKVAKCGNASCTAGNAVTTVDGVGDVGKYSSITIGTDGNPVISYYDAINGDLKVAKCGNPYCLNNWRRR